MVDGGEGGKPSIKERKGKGREGEGRRMNGLMGETVLLRFGLVWYKHGVPARISVDPQLKDARRMSGTTIRRDVWGFGVGDEKV